MSVHWNPENSLKGKASQTDTQARGTGALLPKNAVSKRGKRRNNQKGGK